MISGAAGGWTHAKPRSREGKRRGLLWCVVNCLLSFQLSQIYSLWHGCHGPLTPDPSRPFHGGEGRISGQWGCRVAGLTRSREAAKEGRLRTVFEYEYEYRPPGRTEYEYEGVGQWVVGWFGVSRSREGAKGNAMDSVRCSIRLPRLILFVARAFQPEPSAGFLTVCVADFQGGWPPLHDPLPRFTGVRGARRDQ